MSIMAMLQTAASKVNQDKIEQAFGIEIKKYLSQTTGLSVGIINQPEPHYFFHRPLSAIFAACFAAGFVLDGLEEPAFPDAPGAKNPFSWAKRPEIPPAIVVRIKKTSN